MHVSILTEHLYLPLSLRRVTTSRIVSTKMEDAYIKIDGIEFRRVMYCIFKYEYSPGMQEEYRIIRYRLHILHQTWI